MNEYFSLNDISKITQLSKCTIKNKLDFLGIKNIATRNVKSGIEKLYPITEKNKLLKELRKSKPKSRQTRKEKLQNKINDLIFILEKLQQEIFEIKEDLEKIGR